MCGRFTMMESNSNIIERFSVQESLFETAPRYNIAPSQPVTCVWDNGTRLLDGFKWGLIPSWSKDPKIGNKMINARGETLAEKPSFRNAYKRRRCLIPSTGFYEWKREGSQKTPMFIHLTDQPLFAFAGLWEEWLAPDGSTVRSCTIITTEANSFMAPIHQRMPVIFQPEDEATWLDPTLQNPKELQTLIRPYASEAMAAYPVSTHVNSPANDDETCIQTV